VIRRALLVNRAGMPLAVGFTSGNDHVWIDVHGAPSDHVAESLSMKHWVDSAALHDESESQQGSTVIVQPFPPGSTSLQNARTTSSHWLSCCGTSSCTSFRASPPSRPRCRRQHWQYRRRSASGATADERGSSRSVESIHRIGFRPSCGSLLTPVPVQCPGSLACSPSPWRRRAAPTMPVGSPLGSFRGGGRGDAGHQ
jgi:hypothetical protein